MRITGDNPEGKAELDNFIDPESRYPVIVTTSKLLSTGVDAQTCKLVVLDRRIGSMTEFKQILTAWTEADAALIAWYESARDRMPTEPFRLAQGVAVIGPTKFFDTLERDIRAGPAGARARMGALQFDLKRLQELFGKTNDNGRLF
jgi:hypothetical protein